MAMLDAVCNGSGARVWEILGDVGRLDGVFGGQG